MYSFVGLRLDDKIYVVSSRIEFFDEVEEFREEDFLEPKNFVIHNGYLFLHRIEAEPKSPIFDYIPIRTETEQISVILELMSEYLDALENQQPEATS